MKLNLKTSILVVDAFMLGTFALFGEEAVLGTPITFQRRVIFVVFVVVANIIALFED